ncbi:MAG: sugar transporter permease [Rhodospirillales bacterium]|nr:sugar transporter permease [Rhodospirillales bacterium]
MIAGIETEILVITASILRLATPLILAAIGGLFAERAGVADLGLEGKMLAAAFTAASISAVTGSAITGLAAAIIVATLLSMLHFIATVWKQGDQIVSGMAINILAAGLVPTLAYALFPLGGQTPPLTDDGRLLDLSLPFSHWASSTGFIGQFYASVLGGQSILIYVAFLAAPAATAVLYRTGWGLRLRAAGENPQAVASAGLDVVRLRLQGLIMNGVFLGLAGGYLSLAANAGYSRNMTAGKGYLAIAALILGRWKPWPTLGACLLFAAADALQGRLQGIVFPALGVIPVPWITALPYIVTVIVLAIAGRGQSMPKALGLPYVKA